MRETPWMKRDRSKDWKHVKYRKWPEPEVRALGQGAQTARDPLHKGSYPCERCGMDTPAGKGTPLIFEHVPWAGVRRLCADCCIEVQDPYRCK